MLSERVRELPVIDACGKLLGVVRAEDLFGIREETVKPAIRPVRLVVPADALPVDAVRMMQKVGSDQAVVVDGEKVVGLFAWQDAVERLAD
jgi:Mg/Co/Ni transporter MgtE